MKKSFLLLTFALLPLVCPAQIRGRLGQEQASWETGYYGNDGLRFDVRIGLGAIPEHASDLLMGYGGLSIGHYDYYYYDNPTLPALYQDYQGGSNSTDAIGVDVLFHVSRRVDVGLGMYVNHLWYDTFNGVTQEKTGVHKAAAFYLAPSIRLYYMNKQYVRLYGQCSVGLAKYFNYDTLQYTRIDYDGIRRTVNDSRKAFGEFVPFGIEVGRRFFFFMEAGVGSMYNGLCLGAGYKF